MLGGGERVCCGAVAVMSRLTPYHYMAVSILCEPNPCKAVVEDKSKVSLDFLKKSMCNKKKAM